MKTPFKVFEIFPKLYVKGCAAALNENESHYRPPPGPGSTTFQSRGQAFFANFFVTYYQKNACTFGREWCYTLSMRWGIGFHPKSKVALYVQLH